ncbi:hypothetical protein BT1A1_1387 [Caldibacillus thermoamylovorans]|uniref:Uncharacterized protein n=1 Tax=Caldibacillus thermoamylovorans TaxID=35841 RepID=A0A090IU55_9BACI|nr:hypothetical protein BT1A1_1387 [Caldibacillus thermoamylovorans]
MEYAFCFSDPDWVRTSDPHPVKVVLSQLSYGIIIFLSITLNNIMETNKKVKDVLLTFFSGNIFILGRMAVLKALFV